MAADSISLEDAARQLVERLASIPNFHGPVRLDLHLDPNLPDTSLSWKELFHQELENHHVSVTGEAAAPLLKIGIAGTPTQVVLSASVPVGESDEVRIVALPRVLLLPSVLPVAPVRLDRQLVYQTEDRILDASSLGNAVDGGLALLLYRGLELLIVRLNTGGAVKQTVSLAAANLPPSRDPRGELNARGTDAHVLFPGKSCEFSWERPAEVKCYPTKYTGQGWRNATVLLSPCDGGAWKLEANGSDWTTGDLLQLVPEAASRKDSAAVLSQFPGPILSMNQDQNPGSALVVGRNLRTGNDEVYEISLACGN